jgi:hypothetical protein
MDHVRASRAIQEPKTFTAALLARIVLLSGLDK